jgi:predicted DNA-binding protein (UPF0251 family)
MGTTPHTVQLTAIGLNDEHAFEGIYREYFIPLFRFCYAIVKRVIAAIDQLPPKCKLIFKLIKEDGLKYKEVARLLDLSVKTVETQLSIAVRKIAQALGR